MRWLSIFPPLVIMPKPGFSCQELEENHHLHTEKPPPKPKPKQRTPKKGPQPPTLNAPHHRFARPCSACSAQKPPVSRGTTAGDLRRLGGRRRDLRGPRLPRAERPGRAPRVAAPRRPRGRGPERTTRANSLGGTREAPGRQERTNWTACEDGGKKRCSFGPRFWSGFAGLD